LELKRIGQGWTYDHLEDDLEKLDTIISGGDSRDNLNGLLLIGFDRVSELMARLEEEFNKLTGMEKYPEYEVTVKLELELARMDAHDVHARVTLLLHKQAYM
jgi:hypothetical protein